MSSDRALRETWHRRGRTPSIAIAAFAIFLGAIGGAQSYAASPATPLELTPQRASERVYFFRGESGLAAASNRGYIANAGFVVTGDGVVVFDALGSPVLGDAMIRAIRRVTQQPIRRLILSHYHADHFYGAQSFKAIGAEIWAGERGKAYLESDLALQRLQERRHDLAPDVDARTRLVPADRWLTFPGEQPIRFAMGATHFRIVDVGGAHSPEDLMLFVEEDRVLFAGDLFFTGRIPYVGNADSRAWLVALDRMAPLHPKVVLPGHGDLSTDPEKDVALTRDYLAYLRATMGTAARDLSDFDEAYRNTDWSRFASYPLFEQANRLNAYGTYLLMQGEALGSTGKATAAGAASLSPDYEREARWAREIEPSVVVGEAVYLATPSQPRVLAIHTEAAKPKGGVIVLHGLGVHPDWGLIGGMRTGLADAGFSTLSVQMPVLAADAPREAYSAIFPQAAERIAVAITWFKRRGVQRIAIVAHSLGAAMSNAYLGSASAEKIDAWVVIGMGVGFDADPRQPVLDVQAQSDFPQVREAAVSRASRPPRDSCSRPVVIADADHYMENRQKELVAAIVPFLDQAFAGRCL